MLLGTLAASLLGNLLKGKGAIANMSGEGTIRAGEEQLEQVKFSMLCYPLTNFETQKHEMVLLNLMVYIQEIIFLK